jgi:N-acetylglutamate synthase-like GNAT family acetyltransferase
MNPRSPSPDLPIPFDLRNDFRPGDLGAIVSLHGIHYARESGFDSTFEAYVACLLGEFVNARTDRDQFWIAEWQRRIVGSIAMVSRSRRDAQLSWFLVDPSAGSLGLGSRLLHEAVAFCLHGEYEYVFVRNPSVLTTASRMFRSVGFEKVGESPSERWGVAVIEELYVLHLFGRRHLSPTELASSGRRNVFPP